VPIILAMTIMEKNGKEYGLDGVQMDAPLDYDTVDMTAKTNMALISDILDTPLPELAELNPSILRTTIPAEYPVHVPKGMGTQLMAGLELIPADHRDAWRLHRVGTGETLAEVGKRFGITVNSLVQVNNLQNPEASEGDRLIIPAAARPEPVAAAKRPATAARRTGTSSTGKAKAPAAAPKPNTTTKPKTPAKSSTVVAAAKAH